MRDLTRARGANRASAIARQSGWEARDNQDGEWCRGEVMIAAMIVARKSFVRSDCRGASISECFW
ncbi:hypothetical protein, partial [Bradyrhizobium sp. 193]|uniref:hypothetical protein n=1 Tax=Bradyrhizobium sp. 193 TaxID=2782661 RepID=UPI001FFB3FF0